MVSGNCGEGPFALSHRATYTTESSSCSSLGERDLNALQMTLEASHWSHLKSLSPPEKYQKNLSKTEGKMKEKALQGRETGE